MTLDKGITKYLEERENAGYPIARQKNFRLVQIERNCRRNFKVIESEK